MASAASRTFGVTELLEAILIQAPAKDVLLLQRVNKTWLRTISNSIELQRKLFFKSESSTPLKFFYIVKDNLGPVSPGNQFSQQAWKYSKDGVGEIVVRSNPLVVKVYEALRRVSGGASAIGHLSAPWQMPTASWRRMLLTQPSVEARFAVLTADNRWEARVTRLINTDEVRLGDIVDWVDTEYASVFARDARPPPGRCVRILGEHKWQVNIPQFSNQVPSVWFQVGIL